MGVSVEEAREFIKAYFKEFSGVRKWLDDTAKFVKKHKYVKTLTGRYRRLPGVDSNNRSIQGDCLRQATNAPVQSSGSDMTVTSLTLINQELKKRGLRSVIAITVHDSIVADTHVDELEEVYQIMKEKMQNPPFEWAEKCPIVAEFEIGRNYGQMVDFDSPEVLEGYNNVFDYIDTELQHKLEKDLKTI